MTEKLNSAPQVLLKSLSPSPAKERNWKHLQYFFWSEPLDTAWGEIPGGNSDTINHMAYLWDYDEKELAKTEQGRIFILERMINYGPTSPHEKISLFQVKKYWDKLDLYEPQKHLLELLLWGKCRSSHGSNNSLSIK